jgi:predicted GNAT family acetyltransferase
MTSIINQIHKEHITKYITQNLFNFYLNIAKENNLTYFESDTYSYVKNVSGVWPSYTLGFHSKKEMLEKDFHSINNLIEQKLCPPLWIIPQNELSPELFNLLKNNNFRPITKWAGMALELENLTQIERKTENFHIKKISELNDFKSACEIINASNFDSSKILPQHLVTICKDNSNEMYALWFENKIVSISLISYSDGVAGGYLTATSKEARGKGFGLAVLAHSLHKAIRKGFCVSVIQSSKMGEKVWEKLGFQFFNDYTIFWKVGKQFR